MTDSFDELLARIIELLEACGWGSEAAWFSDRRDALRGLPQGSEEFRIVLQELDGATGGMGGFTDIPLTPRSDRMTVQEARDKQWQLAEALGEAIEELTPQ